MEQETNIEALQARIKELEEQVVRLEQENGNLKSDRQIAIREYMVIWKACNHFLTYTLPANVLNYLKLPTYLRWLFTHCASDQPQGFCFSPAHKKYLECVSSAENFRFNFPDEDAKRLNEQLAGTANSRLNAFREGVLAQLGLSGDKIKAAFGDAEF